MNDTTTTTTTPTLLDYAARIAADGHPINPLGRRIGEGKNPRVAYGGDGYLMPTKKGQQAPDLRYFK